MHSGSETHYIFELSTTVIILVFNSKGSKCEITFLNPNDSECKELQSWSIIYSKSDRRSSCTKVIELLNCHHECVLELVSVCGWILAGKASSQAIESKSETMNSWWLKRWGNLERSSSMISLARTSKIRAFCKTLSLLLARLQSPEHAGRLGVIAELAPHQLDALQPPVRCQG